ncbi:FtsB/FtsL family cell division protein [Saccharopolyspora rosea]|uniref:Cell division protein FtsL n=1 Tax=Saccharopolyspora rosea TaxID=524884 RepID=A0ABW3FVL0_9PSEU|nr:hypothetical protein [Saccharopolyspora rosea]
MTAPARASRGGNGKTADKRQRTRSAAAERAYARREERRDRSQRDRRPRKQRTGVEERRPQPKAKRRPARRQLQEKVTSSRAPLVVAGMALLATGLAATLWLSIATVSGSYRLQEGEARINALNEQREQLMREVSSLTSPPALQRRATTELGMVPGPPPAHLVPQPGGGVLVVGEPEKAKGAPAPPPGPAVGR